MYMFCLSPNVCGWRFVNAILFCFFCLPCTSVNVAALLARAVPVL